MEWGQVTALVRFQGLGESEPLQLPQHWGGWLPARYPEATMKYSPRPKRSLEEHASLPHRPQAGVPCCRILACRGFLKVGSRFPALAQQGRACRKLSIFVPLSLTLSRQPSIIFCFVSFRFVFTVVFLIYKSSPQFWLLHSVFLLLLFFYLFLWMWYILFLVWRS